MRSLPQLLRTGARRLLPQTAEMQPLPVILGTGDLLVCLIFVIAVFSDAASLQLVGAPVFLYWTLSVCTFFLPGAFVTHWLMRHMPGQGSLYVWFKHVFGPTVGFIATFATWTPGLLIAATAIEEAVDYLRIPSPGWLNTPLQQGLAMLIVLCLVMAVSCFPLRYLRRLLIIACVCYCALYSLIGGYALWWLLRGHQLALPVTHLNWLIVSRSVQFGYSTTVLALLGINYPVFLGGEVRGGQEGFQRASRYIWWGGCISLLLCLIASFSFSILMPTVQENKTLVVIQLWMRAFGPGAAYPAVIALSCADILLAIVYMLLFSRLLVTLAQHHRLPPSFASTNQFGVPIVSLVMQALVIFLVIIAAFIIVPSLFEGIRVPARIARDGYEVILAGALVLLLLSMAFLFVIPLTIFIRRAQYRWFSLQSSWQRSALLCLALLGTIASLVGAWCTLSVSWTTSFSPPRWGSLVLLVVTGTLALGWIFGEFPRMRVLVREQRRETDKERNLREQLQEAYQQQEVLLFELERLYREQAFAAITDQVTGLPNRRAVMNNIDETIYRCQPHACSFAIFFVDLDNFKSINDLWGHQAGDAILHETGQCLRSAIRETDFVGRYGGEEFALIVTDISLEQAKEIAEGLRVAVQHHPCSFEFEGQMIEVAITASIGVALYPQHGTVANTLINQADRAMYQAKLAGRNCVRIAG